MFLRLVHGQGTDGFPKVWKLTVANVGTTGYHCKETADSQRLELLVSQPGKPEVYHCKQLPVSHLGTIGLPLQRKLSNSLKVGNWWFPNVGTKGYHGKETAGFPDLKNFTVSQTWETRGLLLQGIAGFPEVRNLCFSKLSGYHCKENCGFPKAWKLMVSKPEKKVNFYQWKDLFDYKKDKKSWFLNVALFCFTEQVTETFCFCLMGPVAECFASGCFPTWEP